MRVATRKVRQRLIEQIPLRVAHNRAANGHALALAARQGFWQTVQIVLKLQNLGGIGDGGINFRLGLFGQLHRKGHIVAHGHMRIKRVRLEHHCYAALRGGHVIHHLPADLQLTAGDFLEPGNHAQKRRFATTRRADKHDQLAGLDIKVDVPQHIDRAAIGFGDIRQFEISHFRVPLVELSARGLGDKRLPRAQRKRIACRGVSAAQSIAD